MSAMKIIKSCLFGLIYSTNLFFALVLWLCGESGNIMLGILAIAFYRLSLWTAPAAVTLVCWLPSRPKISARTKILFNLVHLALSGLLFVLCYLLFGNWF